MKNKHFANINPIRVICDCFHLKTKKRGIDHLNTDAGMAAGQLYPRNKVPGALEVSRLPIPPSR